MTVISEAQAIESALVERVPAHDLAVGDHIIVDAANGDYVGRIYEIVEYEVFHPLPHGAVDRPLSAANTRCLCIRLPHLNTYRMIHDTVRRIRVNNVPREHI